MLSHLVLMRLRADLTAAERDRLAAAFEQAASGIPAVRNVRIGRRILHGAGYEQTGPEAPEYVVILEFEDLAGLRAYLAHPIHAELGARFRASVSSAKICDFETGGIEMLKQWT
jgi:hypothetical protein